MLRCFQHDKPDGKYCRKIKVYKRKKPGDPGFYNIFI
jgi:hypothetical protein